jgi:hypothetical protein
MPWAKNCHDDSPQGQCGIQEPRTTFSGIAHQVDTEYTDYVLPLLISFFFLPTYLTKVVSNMPIFMTVGSSFGSFVEVILLRLSSGSTTIAASFAGIAGILALASACLDLNAVYGVCYFYPSPPFLDSYLCALRSTPCFTRSLARGHLHAFTSPASSIFIPCRPWCPQPAPKAPIDRSSWHACCTASASG